VVVELVVVAGVVEVVVGIVVVRAGVLVAVVTCVLVVLEACVLVVVVACVLVVVGACVLVVVEGCVLVVVVTVATHLPSRQESPPVHLIPQHQPRGFVLKIREPRTFLPHWPQFQLSTFVFEQNDPHGDFGQRVNP
jgi:hypothetical protein